MNDLFISIDKFCYDYLYELKLNYKIIELKNKQNKN